MSRKYRSPVKQKILLLLAAGAALGLSRSPKVHWRILRGIPKAWKDIDRTVLRQTIREFIKDGLVDIRKGDKELLNVRVSNKGRYNALLYEADSLVIKMPRRWDRKWRMVIFDIPESKKGSRASIRGHLENMGFYPLQRSVWVHPFECKEEVEFLIRLFKTRHHVQYLVVESILYDQHIKKHFKLS